jgi:hypothetical protein
MPVQDYPRTSGNNDNKLLDQETFSWVSRSGCPRTEVTKGD